MLAAFVVLVLTGIVTGIVALAGAGIFALILVPIGIGVAIWLAMSGGTGTGPREVASRESSQEFLGPGGPDDPDR